MSDILPNSLLKTAIRENQWDKVKKSSKIGKPPKKIDICFRKIFSCCGQSLISEGETGHWTLSPTKFGIFLIFHSFLRS